MRPEDEWLLTFIEAMVAHGKPCDVRISSLRAAIAAVAPLIAAAEREACAMVVETADTYATKTTDGWVRKPTGSMCRIAAAIRARKEVK